MNGPYSSPLSVVNDPQLDFIESEIVYLSHQIDFLDARRRYLRSQATQLRVSLNDRLEMERLYGSMPDDFYGEGVDITDDEHLLVDEMVGPEPASVTVDAYDDVHDASADTDDEPDDELAEPLDDEAPDTPVSNYGLPGQD